MGQLALRRGNYGTAVDEYQAAQAAKPDDPAVLEGLGEALWRDGRATKAVSVLENAMDLSDRARLDRSVSIRLRLGDAYIDAGRPSVAVKVLRQGLAVNGSAEFWTALARARLALYRWVGASRAADRAIKLDPGLALAHAIRAAALLEQNQYEEAVKSAEAALTINPRDPLALRVAGQALVKDCKNPDIDKGIRLTRQYLEQLPKDVESRLFLARTMTSAGRSAEDVIAVLEAGIGIEGADKPADLYLELAEAYLVAENPEPALRILERTGADTGDMDGGRWWRLRGDALRTSDTEVALDAYASAFRIAPSDVSPLERRASLLGEQGRFEEAMRAWQEAADTDPHDGRLKLRLALAARCAGDSELAWAAVGEAIETSVSGDDSADAWVLRAELAKSLERPRDELVTALYEAGRGELLWKGNFERALIFLGSATKLAPNHSARWYKVDAVFCQTYLPNFPHVDTDRLGQARLLWEEDLGLGLPTADEAWAYHVGARIAWRLGDLQQAGHPASLIWEAISLVERSLVLNEADRSVWIELARFHRAIGNLANAFTASERAIRDNEDDLAAIDRHLTILADRGETAAARELVDKRRERERTNWADGVHTYVLYLESAERPHDQKKVELLKIAVEQLDAIIAADCNDFWALSLRADCLRQLALIDPAGADNYRRLARESYLAIWKQRENTAFAGQERTFAAAACGLREWRDALHIIELLLDDPMDPNCAANYRISGCCYLHLGELESAEKHFNLGIDHASTWPQLEHLDLKFAEIEQEVARWAHWDDRFDVLDLLSRLRTRANGARIRVQEPPSAMAELRRFIDWEEARRRTGGWSWIGANAGLAQLCLAAGEVRQAEAIYRSLGQQAKRFPEVSAGLARVAARCREFGEAALKQGWDQPEAIGHFEHALALGETLSDLDHGGMWVRLAIVQFQAGLTEQATESLSRAVKSLESEGKPDPGASVGENCYALLPDIARYWDLDGYLRGLMLDPGTPEPLRVSLNQAVARMEDCLHDNKLNIADRNAHYRDVVAEPIDFKFSLNLLYPPDLENSRYWLREDSRITIERFLLGSIREMRERIADETGVVVPSIHICDDIDLPEGSFIIILNEVPIVMGSIPSGARYSPSPKSVLEAVGIPAAELKEAKLPAIFAEQSGCWVPKTYWGRVQEANSFTLWANPMQFALVHLEAVLRLNLTDFIGVQEVSNMLELWRRTEKGRDLIATALPDAPTRDRFVRLLRALLRERLPITDWEGILVAVRQVGLKSDNIDDVLRAVRLTIKEELPGNRPGMKLRSVPAAIEEEVLRWVRTADGRRSFAIPPAETQELLGKVRDLLGEDCPSIVLVTEREDARGPLRHLIELEFPNVMVQWRGETLGEDERPGSFGGAQVIAEWSESSDQDVEAANVK